MLKYIKIDKIQALVTLSKLFCRLFCRFPNRPQPNLLGHAPYFPYMG